MTDGTLPPEQPPEGMLPPGQPSQSPLEPPTPTVLGDPTPQIPAAAPPPPPPRSGMSGCAKAAIIGGVVVVLVVIAVLAVVFFGISRFVDNIDDELSTSDSCDFVTDAEASVALGVSVSVESGDSALGTVLGIIRDTRLLADEPFCFISSDDSSTQAWVSVYEGGDAEEVFANAKDVADGQVVSSSSDASGSITVESDAFKGEDVAGLGDEAFCTDAGFNIFGGVLARSGNRVVYVSVLPLEENQGSDVLDGSLCERAVPLARAVLDLRS
ncbi:MAG TPA: hypothetical protein VM848_16465 [Acidimicrobiia bacterium]|nr:hypothetical protein [Acidimicrobiia bacterium]